MYVDAHLVLSSEQDLSQTVATYNSTNVIDFGDGSTTDAEGVLALGGGHPIYVKIVVVEAFAGSGASVQFQLETDYAVAFGGTPVVLAQTAAIGVASLTAGTEITLSFLPEHVERYVRVNYVISGATTTAGTCDAFLVIDRQDGADVN